LGDWHPCPAVQFVGCELDVLFVGAEIAAVEDVENLVAFVCAGCPVNDQQPSDLATARRKGTPKSRSGTQRARRKGRVS